MLHHHRERNATLSTLVWRETSEPRVRLARAELRGPRLSCDADGFALHGATASAARDHVAHGARQERRSLGAEHGPRRGSAPIGSIGNPAALRHRSIVRDRRGHARHLEWRDQHFALTISGKRQRPAQIDVRPDRVDRQQLSDQ